MRYRLIETVGAVRVYRSTYGIGRRMVDTTKDGMALALVCVAILTVGALTLLFK